jgi:hypothetical protein
VKSDSRVNRPLKCVFDAFSFLPKLAGCVNGAQDFSLYQFHVGMSRDKEKHDQDNISDDRRDIGRK